MCFVSIPYCIQAIDPLDPMLQSLVQDKLFCAAVQTSQIHAAAAAAVKVLKVRLPGVVQYALLGDTGSERCTSPIECT